MTTETLEELRSRLLRQESVQQMIQMRAYEIYQMRGGRPGGEAHDWFHAEAEVLAFLLADESSRNDDQPEGVSVDLASAPNAPPVARKTKPRSQAKSAEAKTTAQKKPSMKRASPKKSTGSKSGATRTSRKSKPEGS